VKQCKKCGTVKPLDEFYRDRNMADGHRNDCRACNAAAAKARYVADPAAAVARVKRWQQANPDRLNAYRRQRRQDPAVKQAERASYLRRKYDLSIEQYDQLLANQGGRCGICRQLPSSSISLHVDHDHQTGRIRGLLCFVCNSSLGEFDDPAQLRAAARYLEGPPQRDPLIEARLAELKAMPRAY